MATSTSCRSPANRITTCGTWVWAVRGQQMQDRTSSARTGLWQAPSAQASVSRMQGGNDRSMRGSIRARTHICNPQHRKSTASHIKAEIQHEQLGFKRSGPHLGHCAAGQGTGRWPSMYHHGIMQVT